MTENLKVAESPPRRTEWEGARAGSKPPESALPPSLCRGSRVDQASLARLVERLAPTNVTVTVLGETGTGKDVIARALHAGGPRRDKPFVVFDCGAVAANLVESELFGHERGAFTGAIAAHAGALERAHGGTLFLDEIGELPLDLQPRLLRVLESGQVRRVGGASFRTVEVRVIAATNRDLQDEVRTGRFREDLYFRLAGAFLRLTPLRERMHELTTLIPALLRDIGAPNTRVSPEAYELLHEHDWPGNVRELKNTLNCARAFAEDGVIRPEHLHITKMDEARTNVLQRLPLGGQPLVQIERAAIRQTLLLTQGNKAQAAVMLGIAVSTLYEKLKKLGIASVSTRPPRSSRPHLLEPLLPRPARIPSWEFDPTGY